MDLIYRSSLSPESVYRSGHWSGALTGTFHSTGSGTMRSGLPMCHLFKSSKVAAGGRSAGLPSGAPAETHETIVPISSSERDGSSLNFWTPIVLSMNHGGISRLATLFWIDFAQGRASL